MNSSGFGQHQLFLPNHTTHGRYTKKQIAEKPGNDLDFKASDPQK